MWLGWFLEPFWYGQKELQKRAPEKNPKKELQKSTLKIRKGNICVEFIWSLKKI